MNSGLPEMLHCSETSEMSVLERQRCVLKWQHEKRLGPHPPLNYLNYLPLGNDQGLCEVVNGAMKPDPDVQGGDDFQKLLNYGNCSDFEISSALPRTVSCPPNVAAGKQSCKKRKADRIQNLEVAAEEKAEQKKLKECAENSNSKSTTTTLSTSADKNSKGPSKQSSKGAEAPKTDYIHVRARRGQATDSHSLAERVRREKISERMKYLQDLVPGCNKVTGKAGMLDEIINYVQSLQRQVEFLSMKLAAINPRMDFDIESYIMKEVINNSQIFPGCPTIGASSSSMVNQCHLQFNAAVQEMVVDSMDDATLRRTISAPISIPQAFLDSSSLNQIQQQITWEDELQNLYSMEYQQGRSPSFISQPITGFMEASHVKLEM